MIGGGIWEILHSERLYEYFDPTMYDFWSCAGVVKNKLQLTSIYSMLYRIYREGYTSNIVKIATILYFASDVAEVQKLLSMFNADNITALDISELIIHQGTELGSLQYIMPELIAKYGLPLTKDIIQYVYISQVVVHKPEFEKQLWCDYKAVNSAYLDEKYGDYF